MHRVASAVCLIVFLLIFGVSHLVSASPAQQADTTPQQVNVSVVLLGIRDFDPRNGSFIADFYLDLYCDEGQTCNPHNFELTNGSVIFKEDLSSSEEYTSYRVQARLYSNLDFRNYPFDRQSLTIQMEDKLLPREEIVYKIAEEVTVVDEQVQVPGWEIVTHQAQVDEHYYPTWDQVYSRYRFSLVLQRPVLSSLVKGLMPAFLVALVAFFSLFISTGKGVTRLSVLLSTFVTAVLLHLNMINSIPAVSYLTFADRFMLANYVMFTGALGLTIWSMALVDRGQVARAERLDRSMRWLIPLLWLAMQAANLWLLFN